MQVWNHDKPDECCSCYDQGCRRRDRDILTSHARVSAHRHRCSAVMRIYAYRLRHIMNRCRTHLLCTDFGSSCEVADYKSAGALP
jgi:hypothetical protein